MSEFALEHKPSRRLWIFAAVGALSLHLGGAALAIAHMSSDDAGDSLGANAIEIGIELGSPHAEDSDLPPGPDADASVASPALAEQKAEVKPTDVPKDTPDETEDADRVVTQNEAKKPAEDDPKEETVQTAASQESVAQEATAQQKLEGAREALTTTAPNIGIGRDKQNLTAEWGRQISAYFKLHQRYPKVTRNKPAKVTLNVVINRQGHVVYVGVMESSGDPLYDDAAISMVRRSDPVPRPPAKLTDDEFSYSLDVNFKGGG
jgi:periplasmic protein TonB